MIIALESNGVIETGTGVTGGIDSIPGSAAKAHADSHNDAEGGDNGQSRGIGAPGTGCIAEPEQQGRAGKFAEEVVQSVLDGRSGGEYAQLGGGILGGIKLLLPEHMYEECADKRADHFAQDHPQAVNKGHVVHHDVGDDNSGIHAGTAGSVAIHEGGNGNGQTPGNGDLDGTGALHAGLIQADVCANAVAEENQSHGCKQLAQEEIHDNTSFFPYFLSALRSAAGITAERI